jgi:hypothetical protein
MWRVVLLLLAVLILDFVLFYVGWSGTIDMNMLEISRAVAARETNFSRETQAALDRAFERAEIEQLKVRAWFGGGIVFVTTAGFFIGGRWFERHRLKKRLATSSVNATPHT